MRLALILLACAAAAHAQDAPPDTTDLPPDTPTYDVRIIRAVYDVDHPVASLWLHGVNETAYPVYYGAAPVHWAVTAALGGDLDAPLRLTLAEAGTIGLTFAVKNLVRRPRPYAALDEVDPRDRRHVGDDVFDPNSFPSGHTSTAFVIATSLSLSYPEWYVIAPSFAWAGSMGVARMWLGVHYPSDVLVGAALGAGAATVVHFFLPDVFDGEADGGAATVPLRLVIPL